MTRSLLLLTLGATTAFAQAPKQRARELGLPIGGTAGPLDAITDVAGVEVGHTTLISGAGKLVVGGKRTKSAMLVVTFASGRDLILADDPAGFADAVCRVLDDAPLGERLGKAGRALVAAEYSWDSAAATLEDFYRRLVSTAR